MSLAQRAFEASYKIRPVQPGGRPIFRLDGPDDAIFYAPGYLELISLSDADTFEKMLTIPADHDLMQPGLVERRDALVAKAEAALTARCRWQTTPFRPECLTLYLSNQCNLHCWYCYANASPYPTLKLELKIIRAAARLVAACCREKSCPFTLVMHGGGEPTLEWGLIEQVLAMHDELAQEYQLPTFRYLATHGVVSADKARWLARHFDLVGLSCDGPPDIQNSQRPGWGRQDTSHWVEQTARILRKQNCPFHVRVTITKLTVSRQAEIVDYLCRQLAPTAIHLEPVYVGGRAGETGAFEPDDALNFVTHFLQARHIAAQAAIPLLYAGSRLNTDHGPYCHIFRDVLNLIPGGAATSCFKAATEAQADEQGVIIGAWDENSERFILDNEAIGALRQSLTFVPATCGTCFNQFHCVGECPDRCPLPGTHLPQPASHKPGFRCRIQKALTLAVIIETADRLRAIGSTSIEGRNIPNAHPRGTAFI